MNERQRRAERYVLAAAGSGSSWREIEVRAVEYVTRAEFRAATINLLATGALVREGIGDQALVRRNLSAWIK